MSIPGQMSFATMHEASAMSLAVLNGQLYASLCALSRLNRDTCRSVFYGAGLHWENALRAQTPEQLVSRQADTLPWLAMQFAGYTRGWMDIASEVTASFSQIATDRYGAHTRRLNTTLDGMARCTRGVDAMLRALNPAAVEVDGIPVNRPPADSQDIARVEPDRASEALAAAMRPGTSPGRRPSSR